MRAPAEDTTGLGYPDEQSRAGDVTRVLAPTYWAPLVPMITRTSPDHDPGLPCKQTTGYSSGLRLTGGPAHNYGSAAGPQPRTTGQRVNLLPPSPLAGIQATQQGGPGLPKGPWLGVQREEGTVAHGQTTAYGQAPPRQAGRQRAGQTHSSAWCGSRVVTSRQTFGRKREAVSTSHKTHRN